RARDGSLYCGYARDPDARVALHNAGRGSRILRGKLPVRLVYLRRLSSAGAALKFEIQLKKQSHAQKLSLSARWQKKRRALKSRP
ncbi:MAG TPA: GIY-YIG nuclease family protein, partial [Candidatus Eremiobacteraceae bacterium]|nr:GIY-YIG nuclease family protein [Candidatus Eremiobacteraceae bacterium]